MIGLLLDQHRQALLRFLEQQSMNVDAGVLRWLLVQQRESQRHRIFGPVFPPDAGAETTVAFRQHEVLLAIAGRG